MNNTTSKKPASPEEKLVFFLEKNAMTITTVESCTGGSIASRIVDVPGASAVLKEAYVTYCDEAKNKIVGVSWETLQKYTAVSSETAKEMAVGGLKTAAADVALAATGLAGPGGGTPEKPVGLVYIACAIQDRVSVKKLLLDGDRAQIRRSAVEEALSLACDMLNLSV